MLITFTNRIRLIIHSEWLGRSDDYVSLFTRLLGNIVTAQGIFLADALRMLVGNLTATPASSRRRPLLPTVSRTTIYKRAHKTLQYFIHLMPSASSLLQGILTKAFPHQSDSERSHVTYTQNLLKVLDYAPELRSDVLTLITERLVKIDIQVQVDFDDLEEDIGEGLVQSIPQARPDLIDEMEQDSESSDDESESDEEDDAEAARLRSIKKSVEKMDALLDILFAHYSRSFATSKTGSGAGGVIEMLLAQFTTTMLPTPRSRHTQFLLFHFVQQSPTYIDFFVGTCVHKVLDKKQPALIRQNAAAYLASFVARGSHVPSNIVRDVFDYISSELDRLRKDHEPTCRGPDLRRYASYYCLVQALLYMFCFRWRDLEVKSDDDEEDEDEDLDVPYSQSHRWKSGVKEALASNLFSNLNPLKACSPAIVNEFARVAKHLSVVYVYHIIETNKRIRMAQYSGGPTGYLQHSQPERESALSVSRDESHQHLDAYFPFDPYHLPRSKRWIEGDYQEWRSIPGLDDEDAEGSESEDDGEVVESDLEEGTATERTEASL